MNTPARFDETAHRVHDYRHLVARWRKAARAAGLKLEAFAQAGDYPIYALGTRDHSDGGLYVSAGIHGDEPAATEGLIQWAEARLPALVRGRLTLPLLILPCLNPWGLVNNRRTDEQGEDLNRIFDRDNVSPIRELKRLFARRRFDLTLHLHEDYDARGTYIYELNRHAPDWGEDLLAHCRGALPIEQRRIIEGRNFPRGVLLRRRNLDLPFCPEAVLLYHHHAPHVITFETPSEFSLARRVRAHVLLTQECVRRLLKDRNR